MDVATAKQYHKTLAELFAELQNKESATDRAAIATRMQNLVQPLFVVNSRASQHINEALRMLRYPQEPVVNASMHTIQQGLQQLYDTIQQHPDPQFVVLGQERYFARPVAVAELRSIAEKERLFDKEHNPFIHALDAADSVADVLFSADVNTLKPVLSRLGFPEAEALVLFRTRVQPSLGTPLQEIPSMRLVKFRSGIPVQIIQHRIL